MASGISRYADISSLVNDIYEGALFTLREDNLLARTVSLFQSDNGMNPRKVTQYSNWGNLRQVPEGEEVVPTQVSRSLLQTLTPYRYADAAMLTDQMMATSPEMEEQNAIIEMGQGTAEYVDQAIAGVFSSLTGGTIGTAGSAISWAKIASARSILQGRKVRGPYTCALHPYQWDVLFKAATITNTEIKYAPAFQDRMTQDYFVTSLFGDVLFVVTANITIDGSGDATGAMYARSAIAYDERKPFNVRPQRNEGREALELHYSIWFGTGVWDAKRGVQIISDAATPS